MSLQPAALGTELPLAADRQPFSALGATPFEDETAVLRAHPYEETVRSLAMTLIWLERPLALHGTSSE
jgi:hypothetical protein